MHKLVLILTIFLLARCTANEEALQQSTKPPNLLFIAVDDLRPELGCYGNEIIKTPNIDRLAARGSIFNHHYVTSPTCGASRFAMLRGKLPRSAAEIRNSAIAEFISTQVEGEVPESFFHHLRRSGYHTIGVGKIPHSADNRVYGYNDAVSDSLEMPYSWDEFYLDDKKWGSGWNAFFGYADGSNRQGRKSQVRPYENADVPDEAYPDGLIAATAVRKLGELNKRDQPFVLAAGFFKPHLPWTAPKKYWDLYDRNDISITATPNFPENISIQSLHDSGEFGNYKLGEEKASLSDTLSYAYQQKLVHAYYASVSYMDAQVGKVLDELERLGLSDNTMIVLWGDHGWHLGDYRVWGKHTLFERSLRSALIMALPGQRESQELENVVSTIDLYPTILNGLGVTLPLNLEGENLVPLMKKETTKSRNVAYGYFRRGITMRTNRYRYTKYFREEMPVELYNHAMDPLEKINVAKDNQEIVSELDLIWQRGNTGIFQ